MRGSFYKAFGSKKELFLRALALYDQRHVQPAVDMLTAEDAQGVVTIRKVFDGALDLIKAGDPLAAVCSATPPPKPPSTTKK